MCNCDFFICSLFSGSELAKEQNWENRVLEERTSVLASGCARWIDVHAACRYDTILILILHQVPGMICVISVSVGTITSRFQSTKIQEDRERRKGGLRQRSAGRERGLRREGGVPDKNGSTATRKFQHVHIDRLLNTILMLYTSIQKVCTTGTAVASKHQ